MKRRKINLGMKDQEKGIEYNRPIKTTVVNEFFAVHGTIYGDDNKIDREDKTLTHIPTGFAVTKRGYTKEALIRVANMLLKLGDWNFTDPAEALKRFKPADIKNTLQLAKYPNAII